MPAPQPGTRPETFASHVGALAWFDHEHQVLLQVISLAAASALHDYAWRLAWAMETFCYRRAHWRDWESTQRTALAAARHIGDRDAQAHAHRGIANACIESGSYEQARRHLAAALQIRKDTGDLASQARIHLDLARSAGWQRRYSAYLRHARQGLELARRAQHRAGEAFALAEVAWALALTGEHQQALSHCDQALKINEETGYRAMDGHLWNTMGYAYHQLGCRTEAAACYQRAVQIQDEFGFRYDKAVTLTSAGEAYRSLGDAPAARAAWRQALTILHDARHPDAAAVAANLRDLDLDGGVATELTGDLRERAVGDLHRVERVRGPRARLSARRCTTGSTATIGEAPAVRDAMTALIPTAPVPTTSSESPTATRSVLRTVPAPVWTPQPKGAAKRKGSVCVRRTRFRALVTA